MDIECEGQCISPDKKCDGIRHCADGKDEHCGMSIKLQIK